MALTRTFVNGFDRYGTLSRQSPSGAHPEPLKRRARGVLGAIGIALCISLCSASPAGMAMPLPTLTPFQVAKFQLGEKEAKCLFAIAKRESNIRYKAVNKSSGAAGAWQIMNKRVLSMSPHQQVQFAIKYAHHRYGSACASWDFWKRNYWW